MVIKLFVCPVCKFVYSGEEEAVEKVCQDCLSNIIPMKIDYDTYNALSAIEKEEVKSKEISRYFREQAEIERVLRDEELLNIYNNRKRKFNVIDEKNFPYLYDYKVEKVSNLTNGASNGIEIQRLLTHYAEHGWKLHTMYSNELGKNTSSAGFGGISSGTNSTISEDILVFERVMI